MGRAELSAVQVISVAYHGRMHLNRGGRHAKRGADASSGWIRGLVRAGWAAALAGLLALPGCRNRTIPPQPPPGVRHDTTPASSIEQRRWALALSAILTEQNTERHDTLGSVPASQPPHDHAACIRPRLEQWWDVHSRTDLLRVLTWLEDGGHRRDFERATHRPAATIAAWDYGRYVALCRWGYSLGYLSEDEAWRRIMPIARLARDTYSSWQEYADSYVAGRTYWSPGMRDAQHVAGIRARLLADPASPWVQLPWDLDLKPDAPTGHL